ncbi:hypothetical protein [Microbacterium sp. zg.Y909]|uniref:hypothetical protein n=1 Tax=Microbacterium sp. zg.Y909 TaxID=2969413 RepID=UPI00214A98C4|nr:hypothetical protein [Microbacterium sp. zg.Y909]MCR2826735.1 hypothetical protein [Microbacterium sp. zg.Y909]
MAIRWITPESGRWIEIAERALAVERERGGIAPQEVASSADARRAEDVLYRDWRRYSRLGWGALGVALWFCASVMAALIPAGFTATLEREQSTAWAVTAAGAVLTAVLAALSLWILLHLRRAGRALTRALAFWVRLPWRRGERRTIDAMFVGTAQTYTQPAFNLRMTAMGIIAVLGALGGALAVWSALRAEATADAGATAAAAVFGAAMAVGLLPTAVGMATGIRRAAFAYSDPRAAVAARFGYGPPEGILPSHAARRGTRARRRR